MSKHTNDFDSALRKVRNEPKSQLEENQDRDRRDKPRDFCHLVKKFPRQAAQSKDAIDFAAHLAQNGNAEMAFEAIEYLFDSEPKFLTYNRHFGFALEALANNGFDRRAKEILRQSVRDWPQNMAANTSLGAALESLISSGHKSLVATQFTKLTQEAPQILARNPSTGWIISGLVKAGKTSEAINAFIDLAKRHPVAFSMNPTVDKAISSLEKLGVAKIFGDSKANTVTDLIGTIRGIQQNPPIPRFE